jgi:integrase
MGSAVPKLTDRLLGSLKLKPGQKDRLVFDTECSGLAVRLTAAGTRKFLAQWSDKATGRKRRETIGVWGSITITAAREAARGVLGHVARGVDPAADRERQKLQADAEREETALTLDKLITDWATIHLAQRRPRYAKEAQRALRSAFASELKKPAARLSKATVRQVLDDMAVKAGTPTMAVQVKAYGRACYGWALGREQVPVNPFAKLPLQAEKSEREHVITDDELADIRTAADALPYPWREFYLVALYALQRRDEIAGMRRSELSSDFTLWTIPGSRMKNKKPHLVHLNEPARVVLRSLPAIEGQDLVFTTNGKTPISGFSKAKRMLDAKIAELRAEPMTPWRLHDFRRTGVSTLAALGFDSIVVDKILAHKPARLKGVAAIYQRHEFIEERRRALDAWAVHLTGSRDGATVLPFRAPSG